jgi:oxygen-independent coproporphyrinogen-3 oxidase
MAGIYIHIPFCRKLCHYCNFHRTTNISNIKVLVNALIKEIGLRKNYLENEPVETIYFGGGTPSILHVKELSAVTGAIYNTFRVNKDSEITLEANPDDLTKEYLNDLKNSTPINRLSIGIQSFYDEDLKLMNRRHDSIQALQSVKLSQEAGFSNISIDLIYGLPGLTSKKWYSNLLQVFNLNVQHISAYHLTFEPGTTFAKLLNEGKLSPIPEDESMEQYELLLDVSKTRGFIHYEISNFALEDYFSEHNSNYWKQKKYLGIGPSAHSYNIASRQWNIADNKKYIEGMNAGNPMTETETLDIKSKYNDYILTSLRTMWGADINYIREAFGNEYGKFVLNKSKTFSEDNIIQHNKNILRLTPRGQFISNYIISELIIA